MQKIRNGCDIVYIPRIQNMMLDASQLKKVFHNDEIIRFEAHHVAGIFAAKEAVIKALDLFPIPSFLDIHIQNKDSGRPYVTLTSNIRDSKHYVIDISISHDNDYAFATAILIENK